MNLFWYVNKQGTWLPIADDTFPVIYECVQWMYGDVDLWFDEWGGIFQSKLWWEQVLVALS